MKTIILPGYSPKNKDWAEEIKHEMELEGVVVHEWKHWDKGSFSFKHELSEIKKKAGDNSINVIAKSVGTRVAMHLLGEIPKKINKIVLCGIPTKGKNEKTFNLYKSGLERISPDRLIIFQNEKDYFAKYVDIVKFIGKINSKIKIVKMPRADHHYPYPTEFKKFLTSTKFLK